MANSSTIGAQFLESYRQIRANKKLPNFLVIVVGIMLVLSLPNILLMIAETRHSIASGEPAQQNLAILILSSLSGLLITPVFIGYFREFLYPAPASFRRPFRAGFARLRQFVWVLPFGILQMLVMIIFQNLPPLLMVLAILPYYLLCFVLGIYWTFLLAGAAAGGPRQDFRTLYKNALTAFAYGWWRMLLAILIITAGAILIGILTAIVFVLAAFGVPVLLLIVLGCVLACVAIVLLIYLWAWYSAVGVRLYRDALELPEFLDENTAEIEIETDVL